MAKIIAAAIRYNPTGQVFTGPFHSAIAVNFDFPAEHWESGSYTEGFVLDTGPFLNREEAMEFACQSGQVAPTSRGTSLITEDLTGHGGNGFAAAPYQAIPADVCTL